MPEDSPSQSHLTLYQTEDNRTRIEVRLEGGTVWLTQANLAELYQTTPQNITLHIGAIYAEGELAEEATCKDYLQVRREGSREVRRALKHYNLEMVLAVGYRVRSHRGTQFRQWATERLREYLVKGFTLDDERLKQGGTKNEYFDELLQRIREIRVSERNFYRKICDIYQTSVDYDPAAEMTQLFFQTVQNKMHYAVHGHTAAELVNKRANAKLPNMGLTTWKGAKVQKADVSIAKNYLGEDELKKLSLIVTQYLDFAELQAMERRLMHMRDWIAKLDGFLRLSDQEILENAGSISAEDAKRQAEREFEKFDQQRRQIEDTKAEETFAADVDALAKKAKQLGAQKPPGRKKKE